MGDLTMGLTLFFLPLLTLMLWLLVLWMGKSSERALKRFKNGGWKEREDAVRKLKYELVNADTFDSKQSIIQALVKAFKDRNWHVRKEAVTALQSRDVRRAIPLYQEYAIHALSDRSENVRKEAAIFLRKFPDRQSIDPLLNALRDEFGLVRREAARALGNISDIRVIIPLLDALGDDERSVQQGALVGLKKACSLVHVIVFGNSSGSRFDPHHTICNPDVSHLTVPMRRLNSVIIETESYHFHQVEQFITYAVNFIGQRRLRKHVEVHLYGDLEKLHPNLHNSLTNLCKRVHVYKAG